MDKIRFVYSDNMKKWVGRIAMILVSFIAISITTFELWEPYQVPKDRYFYLGIIWFLVLIFILRKVSYKDYEIWAVLAVGFLIKYAYFHVKGINAINYGEIYSKVISYTWTIWILFAALIVNSFRRRQVMSTFRSRYILLSLYTVMVIIAAIVMKETRIPLIAPMYALIFTSLDRESWSEAVDCCAVGTYLSFLFVMTKSLLGFRDVYEEGRYMGGFCSVENAAMFAGVAVIACIYFFIKSMMAEKRLWLPALGAILLSLYPLYIVKITDSRSAMMGIAGALFMAFVFARKKKNIKAVVVRLFSAILIVVLAVILLFALGKWINKGIEEGRFTYEELGYSLSHVGALGDPELRKGYFGEDSIWNCVNRFSAGRLECWAETTRQIEWKGHEYREEPPLYYGTPHNFFIMRLIVMGIIPGGLVCAWMLYCLVKECILCAKCNRGAIFPLLWTVYSVAVLSFTITKWDSLLPLGIFLLSYPVYESIKRESNS